MSDKPVKEENKWKVVTLQIRPDQHRRLTELADRPKLSMAELVRDAIDRELTRRQRIADRKKKKETINKEG